MSKLREKAWSPYLSGIVVGLLQIPAFLIIDTALGASSSYVSLAGYVASLFDPDVQTIAYFDKYMTSLKYAWQSAMVIGIGFGAFISMKLSGAKRRSFSPAWTAALGFTRLGPRMVLAFVGGFVMLFGARWAGGCTSGHGLSGMGQLAVGSLMVVVAMFIGGIAVAMFFRKV